jgi:hypothetical protein
MLVQSLPRCEFIELREEGCGQRTVFASENDGGQVPGRLDHFKNLHHAAIPRKEGNEIAKSKPVC